MAAHPHPSGASSVVCSLCCLDGTDNVVAEVERELEQSRVLAVEVKELYCKPLFLPGAAVTMRIVRSHAEYLYELHVQLAPRMIQAEY